jgi:hypothetical protein
MMLTFWEWLGQGFEYGFVQELQRLIREGDEGYQAFIDQTNREFRKMIGAILWMGKFTDPRNEAEARAIVADPTYFNYAQELVAAASGGRARLRGQDVLDGAQDVNVQLWLGWCLSSIAAVRSIFRADRDVTATVGPHFLQGRAPDDLKDCCCLNPAGTASGRRGAGDRRVGFRYGPGKRRRLLARRTCRKRFSERAGTPPFDGRLPEAQAADVPAHLHEGVGVRQTGRRVGVNRNAVVRLALAAGRHAQPVHDERGAFSPSDP